MTTKRPRYRRPGASWRLLVHDMGPGGMSTFSRHLMSGHMARSIERALRRARAAMPLRGDAQAASPYSETTVWEDCEFDELVVGRAIHIEQMNTAVWWMSIAGTVIWLRTDRDGRPVMCRVHMPGCYEEPVEGCRYELNEQPWPGPVG